MAPARFTQTTFSLTTGGAPVEGSVSYADSAVIFTPDDFLLGGVTYTARLSIGVTDSSGNALPSDYVWTFTTSTPYAAYVTNKIDGTISVYWADGGNGRLYPRERIPVSQGVWPISVVVDPSKQFAFVANYGDENNPTSGSVTTFRINGDPSDPRFGSLTEISTIAGVVGWPQSLAVPPSGPFIYAANFGSRALTELRLGSTGDLVYIGVADSGNQPLSVIVNEISVGGVAQWFAYAANYSSSSVTAFSIDQATGALSKVGTDVEAGALPRSVAVDPAGRYLYVANRGIAGNSDTHSVAMFRINQTTGALTDAPVKAKILRATDSAPESVTVDPSGRFLYVADPGAHRVAMFPIDQATGELGEETTVMTGDEPVTVRVDPTGRFAYVVDFAADQVAAFNIDQATGALSRIGTPVETGDQPYGMAMVGF